MEDAYTYPINSITPFVRDELIFYDAYAKFREILGNKLNIKLVSTLPADKLKKIYEFEILTPEDYGKELNNFLKGLFEKNLLKIEKRRRYYCDHCERAYLPSEVHWVKEKVKMNVARIRIGKKLYFLDFIEENEEPLGIVINKNDNLLAIVIDKDIWVAPERLKNVLIEKLEVPERRIRKWRPDELLREEYKLQSFVILKNEETHFITDKNREDFLFSSVIPSYTIIYSLEKENKVPKCPNCKLSLREVNIPFVFIEKDDIKMAISSEEGEYRIPFLYCEHCGHTEIGDKIKECPICENIMSMPFFLDEKILFVVPYIVEVKKPSIGFLHEKRAALYPLFMNLSKVLKKDIFSRTVILRHKVPQKIDENTRAVLLSKKRGAITDNDFKKIRKLKTILVNIRKYMEIYGKSESSDPIDQWILNLSEETKIAYMEAMNSLNFAKAFNILYKFVIEEVSHFYIPMKRPFPILEKIMVDIFLMLYPFLPSFSKENLSILNVKDMMLIVEESRKERSMEIVKDIIKAIRRYRRENGIPRREPIKKVFFVSEHADEISSFTSGIMKMENILFFNPTERWEEMEIEIVPNLEAISQSYRALATKIAFLLRRKNVKEIMDAMNKGGYSLGVEGFIIKITPNMLRYVEKMPQGYVKLDTQYGPLYVLTERDISTERLRFVNEIVRRINFMRKDMELEYDDLIDVSISGDEKIIREIRVYAEEIRSRCRIRNIDFKYREYAYVVVWPILNYKITIAINPLFKKWVIKAFMSIPGIAKNKAETLFHMGYGSIYELMQAPVAEIAEIPEFSLSLASKIKDFLYTHAFKSKKIGEKNFCPFCGTEIGEEDIFCPRCGAPIKVKLEESKEMVEGHIYLFMGDFQRLLTHIPSELKDEKKILVTKENPENARKIYGLKNIRIIWISYVPLGHSIKPKELKRLKEELSKLVRKETKLILMDCFDLLLAINDIEKIKEFLMALKEIVKSTSSLLIFNVEEIEEEILSEILNYVDGRI